MSAVNDKIVDKIWGHAEPIITIFRLLELFVYTTFFSPAAGEVLKINNYTKELSSYLEMWQKILSSVPAWIFLYLSVCIFLIAPFLSSLINKLMINNWHIRYSSPLLSHLVDLKTRAQIHNSFSPNELQELLITKNVGLKSFEHLKVISEVWTTFFIIQILAVYYYLGISISVLIIPIWLLILFLITQKMLIIYLSKVQPFNVVNEIIKVLKLSNIQ